MSGHHVVDTRARVVIPRMYCRGSPRTRLESIVERDGNGRALGRLVDWIACVSHFSSRRALSLPMRPSRVVTSCAMRTERGIRGIRTDFRRTTSMTNITTTERVKTCKMKRRIFGGWNERLGGGLIDRTESRWPPETARGSRQM